MKKKNMILSVAAASALLMSNPMVNKADAASNTTAVQQTKVIYQAYNLNQDQINNLLKKYAATGTVDINKLMAELQAGKAKTSTAANKTATTANKPAATTATSKPAATPAKTTATASKPAATPAKTTATASKPAATPAKTTATASKPAATPAKTTATASKPAATPAKATATASKPAATTPSTSTSTQATSTVSAFEKQVVELTNKERAKNGLAPLTLDTELSKVARVKSQDMSTNNYFDHTSPTYGSPFDMMKQFGISYKAAGENIAKGQATPEEVVEAWMNSEGHRANILSSKFTHIGVGYVAKGNYWTQQFIGK